MKPIISAPGEGIGFELEPGSLVRFRITGEATGGAFEFYERYLPPHTLGADPHIHDAADEGFFVVEGCPTILLGDEPRQYEPGSVVYIPRRTVHGYWNDSDHPMHLVAWFTPALNHHLFFAELAVLKRGPREHYAERLQALRERFGSRSVKVEGLKMPDRH